MYTFITLHKIFPISNTRRYNNYVTNFTLYNKNTNYYIQELTILLNTIVSKIP